MIGQVVDSAHGHCAQHGEFTNCLISLVAQRPPEWSGCPVCAADQRVADTQAAQRELVQGNRRAALEAKIGRSCIPARFADKTFDDFRAVSDDQRAALAICVDYAENFKSHAKVGRSLMLLGHVGTGKTLLATATGNHIMRQLGLTALYMTAGGVIRYVKASFDRDTSHNEQQAYALFAGPDLLILDEVGVQNATEFERTVMFELINSRYENMKPTIVISNRGHSELPTYLGDRVVDRLRENGGKLVLFSWASARGQVE
jgi:DNA replication protein DnaC